IRGPRPSTSSTFSISIFEFFEFYFIILFCCLPTTPPIDLVQIYSCIRPQDVYKPQSYRSDTTTSRSLTIASLVWCCNCGSVSLSRCLHYFHCRIFGTGEDWEPGRKRQLLSH